VTIFDVPRQPAYRGAVSQQYARVRIIPENYQEWLDFVRSLRTRGYTPRQERGLTWQYDGIEYPLEGPLKPGDEVTLPLAIAMHAVKATSVWYQEEVDGLKRPDFRAIAKPLLEIVATFEPGDVGKLLHEKLEAKVPSKCPWCNAELPDEEFKDHVAEHFRKRPAPTDEQEVKAMQTQRVPLR
jgi:hypothetical protein